MVLEPAIAFVRREGNDRERARLDYLLTGRRPSSEVVADLFAAQRRDGGWAPFWAADYSSLDAACFRLAQAEQMGLGAAEPAVQRALTFLERRQAADGSWQEEKRVTALAPPWALPGDLSATLYLTANCGLWLMLLHAGRDGPERSARYLEAHLSEEGPRPGFLHTNWLAGALWYNLGWQEAAERVFAFLDTQLERLPASNLAWLITTLLAAGVAKEHRLLQQAADALAPLQADDGRWPGEDGSAQDVHTTLEALRALIAVGKPDNS